MGRRIEAKVMLHEDPAGIYLSVGTKTGVAALLLNSLGCEAGQPLRDDTAWVLWAQAQFKADSPPDELLRDLSDEQKLRAILFACHDCFSGVTGSTDWPSIPQMMRYIKAEYQQMRDRACAAEARVAALEGKRPEPALAEIKELAKVLHTMNDAFKFSEVPEAMQSRTKDSVTFIAKQGTWRLMLGKLAELAAKYL